MKVSGILKYDIIDTTYNSINNKLNFGPLSINSFVESNFYQKYTGRPSGLTQNRIESSFQFINKWEKGQELQVNYNRNSLSTLDRIESKFYNVVTPEIYFSNENLTDENKEISNNIFNLQFKTNLDSTTKLRFDANINLESFELDLFRKFKSYNWHSSEENSISSSGTQDGESSLSIFNLNVEKEFKQSTLSFSLQPSFNKELIVQNSKSSVGALDSVININRTIDLKRKMLSSYINYEHFLTDNLQSNISYGISIEKSNQTEDISSISRQHITGQSQVVSVDFNYLIKKIGVTSGVRAFFNNINFKDDNLQEIRNFNRIGCPILKLNILFQKIVLREEGIWGNQYILRLGNFKVL